MKRWVFHMNYNYVSYLGLAKSEDDAFRMMGEIIRRDMEDALAAHRGQGEYPGYLPRRYEPGAENLDDAKLVERYAQSWRFVPLTVGEAYDVDYDNLVLP